MNEQEVLALINSWTEAEIAGDEGAFRALLAPEFVGIGPVGFVLDRDQWSQRHSNGLVNTEFTVADPHIRDFGDTSVVEGVLRQQTTVGGRDTSGEFRIGLVAVNGAQGPAIAHLQLSGPLIKPGEVPHFTR